MTDTPGDLATGRYREFAIAEERRNGQGLEGGLPEWEEIGKLDPR